MTSMAQPEEPFNFDQYLMKEDVQSLGTPFSQKSNNVSETEEPFSFDQYIQKPPPTMLQEFGRHASRIGSRALETVVGFPGDLVNFAKFIEEKLPKTPEFLKSEPNIVQ